MSLEIDHLLGGRAVSVTIFLNYVKGILEMDKVRTFSHWAIEFLRELVIIWEFRANHRERSSIFD